jgi:hypothetical protein
MTDIIAIRRDDNGNPIENPTAQDFADMKAKVFDTVKKVESERMRREGVPEKEIERVMTIFTAKMMDQEGGVWN